MTTIEKSGFLGYVFFNSLRPRMLIWVFLHLIFNMLNWAQSHHVFFYGNERQGVCICNFSTFWWVSSTYTPLPTIKKEKLPIILCSPNISLTISFFTYMTCFMATIFLLFIYTDTHIYTTSLPYSLVTNEIYFPM